MRTKSDSFYSFSLSTTVSEIWRWEFFRNIRASKIIIFVDCDFDLHLYGHWLQELDHFGENENLMKISLNGVGDNQSFYSFFSLHIFHLENDD